MHSDSVSLEELLTTKMILKTLFAELTKYLCLGFTKLSQSALWLSIFVQHQMVAKKTWGRPNWLWIEGQRAWDMLARCPVLRSAVLCCFVVTKTENSKVLVDGQRPCLIRRIIDYKSNSKNPFWRANKISVQEICSRAVPSWDLRSCSASSQFE